MTRVTLVAAVICACLSTPDLPASQAAPPESFEQFLQTWEQAQARFINGDAALWKRLASHRDDVTILGGFGGEGEKGWKAVGARYDWAAAQYQPAGATVKVDYHVVAVSGEMAYTVGIERQSGVRIGTAASGVSRALRVTQVFRRENGDWKLVHRHGDQMTTRHEPPPAPSR